MTSTSLPRRALVGAVLSTALVGGALTAFADGGPACTTFTDPKGDSAPADAAFVPGSGEDDLDLTGVAFDTVDATLNVSVYVAALDVAPQYSLGDEFTVAFKHGGKQVDLYSYRYNPTDVGTVAANFYDQTGMDVDGTAAVTTMKVAYDEKASRVVFSLPLADLEKATGTAAVGAALSELAVQSSGDQFLIGEPWDEAAAPKDATYLVGTACGGGAPAPVSVPVATPAPSPAAAPTATIGGGDPSKPPTAGCFLAKDPKGDAHVLNGNVPNDPDVDLTGFTLGSDSKNLYGYIKVDKLADGPQIHDGHRFYLNFTHNKHTFTAAGSAFKHEQAGQFKDGLAQTGQVAHVTQLAVDGVSSATDPERVTGNGPGFVESGLKFVFDQKTSTVQVILPVADIEKYGKAPLAGAVLTGVYVGGYGDAFAVAQPADAAPDGATSPETSKLTYAIGNNACFGTPTPPLKSVGAVKAQYGDTAAVAAKLVDADGKPVAGKRITFSLGVSKVVAATGADGVAKAALLVKDKAGRRTLTVTDGTTKSTTSFTVLLEKTALKAVGSNGPVVATLTDDDRKPVAGQVVTFTSGSKKVTARTDAKGVAKATGFAPGSAVRVAYAGAAGMYSAASTTAQA